MSSLFFYHAAMNAGKSTSLLQSAHNYEERGMKVLVVGYAGDNRAGDVLINSRIGLTRKPDLLFGAGHNFIPELYERAATGQYHCILVDECQFLSAWEVEGLAMICDQNDIPILCYGLKSDFQSHLFEGSKRLLELADKIVEMKTICGCGRKATMNARLDSDGNMVVDGDVVQIGGNESYQSMCRKCYKESENKAFIMKRGHHG